MAKSRAPIQTQNSPAPSEAVAVVAVPQNVRSVRRLDRQSCRSSPVTLPRCA